MPLVEPEVFGNEGESTPQAESIPLQFVPDNHVGLLVHDNNTSAIEKPPNEALEKSFRLAIRSAGFSWPNHPCQVCNHLCNVNNRFKIITQRLATLLPRIHISSSLIKQFGRYSSVVLEVRRIVSSTKWANA